MRRKDKGLVQLINTFHDILKKKPSVKKMYEDIRLMKFKIRPLQGDISRINFQNEMLIEMLWSLGKLDEVFQKEYELLSVGSRDTFYKLFDNLYKEYQSKLNNIHIRQDRPAENSNTLEMEIFKELPPEKKLN